MTMAGKPFIDYQGKKTALTSGETLIGSDASCAVRVAAQGVASVHAAVVVEGDRAVLEDRSPDQDTRVNEHRIRVAEVKPGSAVKFGEIELKMISSESGLGLEGAGQTFQLATGENKVGRQPDCKVRIEDASVSRYHATILALPKKAMVKDLNSTNGTFVDGQRLGEVELKAGDRIQLGSAELTFTVESAAEPMLFELVVDGQPRVLTPGEVTIGRAPDCQISLSDDPEVSRHHTQLTVEADRVRVRDLGSSNGTYLNGSRLSAEAILKNGDKIGVGGHEFVLRSKGGVDPLGKTVLASDLPGLGDKTVLVSKPPRVPPPSPAAAPDDRQAALALLDLSATAQESEIRQRYQELFSEYQIRLTNAPTPKLKEKYNQKIEHLREAFAVLVPGAAAGAAADLPSAKPVAAPEPVKAPAPPVQPPAAAPAAAADAPPVEPEAAPPEKAEKTKVPLPKSVFVMAGLGVIALAVCATMVFLLLGAKRTQRALGAELDGKTQAIERMQQEIVESQQGIESLEQGKAQLLANQPFKVCNLSGNDLRILWLAVAYLDEHSQLKTFDSAFFNYPRWTVKSGGTQKFDLIIDDRVIWDGSALFFSLLFRYQGAEYFRAGAVSTLQDGCYKLALG